MCSKLTGEVGIRAAGVDDAALLTGLHDECFPEPSTVQSLTEILAMPGAFGLAATRSDSERLVGFAIARVAADESELLLLGVAKDERRQGVATNLLFQVTERVREAGCRHLFLEVAETNLAAQALYQAQGFTVVGRRPNYYCIAGGPPIAALTLCRTIRSRAWRWLGF